MREKCNRVCFFISQLLILERKVVFKSVIRFLIYTQCLENQFRFCRVQSDFLFLSLEHIEQLCAQFLKSSGRQFYYDLAESVSLSLSLSLSHTQTHKEHNRAEITESCSNIHIKASSKFVLADISALLNRLVKNNGYWSNNQNQKF